MGIILAISGWASLVYSRHLDLLLPHSILSRVAGISFLILGLIIRILAFKQVPCTLRTKKLVTSGVYSRTRNPVYLAYMLIIIAVAFLTMRLLSFAWVLFSILVFYWVAKKEENDLERTFGEEYLAYKQKVPLFLPKFRAYSCDYMRKV